MFQSLRAEGVAISDATDHLEVIEFNIATPGTKIEGHGEPRGIVCAGYSFPDQLKGTVSRL